MLVDEIIAYKTCGVESKVGQLGVISLTRSKIREEIYR